jgi:uncharacterized protein (DUF58 family)
MRFGPEGQTKADRAAQSAALLATAAIQNGDRVGLLLVSDRIEAELNPGVGIRHLSQLVRSLVATPTSSSRTRLGVGLARIRRLHRRTMTVFISDFQFEEPVALWRQTARRHDLVALRLVDPRERSLPTDASLVRLEDAELGTRQTLDLRSRKVRAGFAAQAEEKRIGFTRWCAATGIDGFVLSTDVDPINPLIEIFSSRTARRGAR